MKKLSRLLPIFFTAVLVFGTVTPAQATRMGNFFNGERYMALSEDLRNSVVAGLFDMLSFEWGQPIYNEAADGQTRASMARIERCIQGKTIRNLREMLDRYITENPQVRAYNLASNFSAALMRSCP